MSDSYTKSLLNRYATLPRFPDGRINFTHANEAPVLNIIVQHDDKILLLKRSDKVGSYQGKWMVIGGYIDEPVPLKEKVLEELREEVSINEQQIKSITAILHRDVYDGKRTWKVHPFLVTLKECPTITLDWEHTESAWINPSEIIHYDCVPGFRELLQEVCQREN